MDIKKFREERLKTFTDITYGDDPIENRDFMASVLSKATGKIYHPLILPDLEELYQTRLKTSPDPKKITEIWDEVVGKFGLVPEGKRYVMRTTDPNGYFLSGEDRVLLESEELLIGSSGVVCTVNTRIGYKTLGLVYYSEDSMKAAGEIWETWKKRYTEILEDGKDGIKEDYRAETVIVQDGEYITTQISITPTVSLTSSEFMKNYNTDFPETRVEEFLEENRGGIVIFNGQPGCGKSTYLKSLIFRYPHVNFTILPQYLLCSQENFRRLLFRTIREERPRVFIVEDCEKLLIQREDNPGFSSIIGDILNYTDGIFGDLTRTKFIFTFNTDLQKIDKALLRPGRLFLKYEFCPLRGENLKEVAGRLGYTPTPDEITDGLPLSELYTRKKSEDLQISAAQGKRKIGF